MDCRPIQVGEIRAYLEPILSRNPYKPVILYTESDAEYQAMIAVYEVLVDDTGDDGRPFPRARSIFIPTASDIEGYADMFGDNPLQTACR